MPSSTVASGRTDVITFGSGFVTLKAEPDHMNAELRLDAAARGLIAGRMRADRNSGDMMNWPMRGQLQMADGSILVWDVRPGRGVLPGAGVKMLVSPNVDWSLQLAFTTQFEGSCGPPLGPSLVLPSCE